LRSRVRGNVQARFWSGGGGGDVFAYRNHTVMLLALVTGRGCAYRYAYVEHFLARLAHAGADEPLTDAVARWTWASWHDKQPRAEPDQEAPEAVFYVDGHRKAVYSEVLVPRGPVGKLGGKIPRIAQRTAT
jgi:hypothetical protein